MRYIDFDKRPEKLRHGAMTQSIDLWSFFAGLGLFLYAISLAEGSLKVLAGRPFKQLLKRHTNNHFKSILIGVFSTAILQSSSAVTLILLAFVGSGVIVFSNALGIILGANLGTTFTGWIVSTFGFEFDIESYVRPIIAVGAMIAILFQSRKKIQSLGTLLLGFGLLFLGLSLMKESASNFQETFNPTLLKQGNILMFALGGFIFTAIIQSSSATMVITLTALHSGLISLESSAALIIGADLGTTITVVLGATNGSAAKRRVAAAHFIFNVIIDSLALFSLPLLLSFCLGLTGLGRETYTLVLFHSSFNVLGILIFLPFLKSFSQLLEKHIGNEDQLLRFKDINPTHSDAALEALSIEAKEQLRRTIQLNLSVTKKDDSFLSVLEKNNFSTMYENIKENEALITNYALKIQGGALDSDQSKALKRILSGIRNCSMAAKSLKDIQHNFDIFKNSSNDFIFNAYQKIINNLEEINLSLKKNISKENHRALFECLVSNLSFSEKGYQDFIHEMNEIIRNERVSLEDIPNLFNSNREVFNSNHLLILATGDIWLNIHQSEDLAHIPQRQF